MVLSYASEEYLILNTYPNFCYLCICYNLFTAAWSNDICSYGYSYLS